MVVVKPITTDRYGRTVAHILVDGLNVNCEMVRMGNAWVYRKYLKEHSLLDLETEAMDAKRGLWGLPEFQRVPPWEWRKR